MNGSHARHEAPVIEVDAIAGYCRGRAAYNQAFPWFYEAIRESVLQEVSVLYPDAGCIVGTSPLGMERSLAKFPGRSVPLEWVAFSFNGLDLHDFHIGVVLDLDRWPATYILGLHIMDELIDEYRDRADAIDWEGILGYRPHFTYAAQVRESRWIDLEHEIDFSDLGAEVARIVDRVTRYYRAAAPLVYGKE